MIMRLSAVFIITIGLLALGLSPAQPGHGQTLPTQFTTHTIATDLRGGYQVVAADLNRDGKPDLIALASGMNELVWFENPGWQRHVLAVNVPRPINCAAWDVDGDGIPEVALAYEFATDPAKSLGIVALLKHNSDVTQPWQMTELDRLPTAHRLRWLDLEGNGRKVLINAPLADARAKAPDYRGTVLLVFYRPNVGANSWKREIISEELQGVLHGIYVTDWDGDKREELLTASFLGIDLFRYGKDKRWQRTRLANGNAAPWPQSGASDVAVGKLGRERFLCAIEPWHGNQVVVYQPTGKGQKQTWQRQVIDDALNDGHTLLTADFNRDGRDEIIAGYRGQGRSVNLYVQETGRWSRRVLDDGGMAAAGCAISDLNGDGWPDVACIGTATTNLKWYENLGGARQRK